MSFQRIRLFIPIVKLALEDILLVESSIKQAFNVKILTGAIEHIKLQKDYTKAMGIMQVKNKQVILELATYLATTNDSGLNLFV